MFPPSASAEYADACGWYQARSQRAANAFERAIEAAVRYVALHPEAQSQSRGGVTRCP
jgi:plasmid stabilization system protein ParE